MIRVSRLLAQNGLTDPWWFTEEARELGRIVHLIAEAICQGQDVQVAPSFNGYKLALQRTWALLDMVPLAIERRLTSAADGVTGRPDVVGYLPRVIGAIPSGPIIVDFKSGAREPSHGVQLALYERLADATPDLRAALPPEHRDLPWTRLGAYVKDTGRFRVHPYTDPHEVLVAHAILTLTEFKTHKGLLAPSADEAGQPDDPAFA